MNHFNSCLEDGERFDINIQSLTRKANQMSRVSTTKRGLNRVFTKFRVEDDGVTCKPLTLDNILM